MTNETPAELATSAPELSWLLLSTLGSSLAAVVVTGAGAGRLGLPIAGALLASAAVLGALPGMVALLRRRWHGHWPTLALAALAFAALLAVGLGLAWPALLPLGGSVDAVHHYLLAHWIAEHQALPPITDDMTAQLGEMVAYPPGLALVVVAGASLTGRAPLDVLYPTVALLGAACAALVVLLALAAGRARAGWYQALPALVAVVLLLGHRTYLLDAYLDHSYYAMVLGVLLVLLAAGGLILEPQRAYAGALQAGLAIAALVATYPQWAPIPAALAGVALLLPASPRPGGAWRQRGTWGRLALALGPALLLALVDLPARLGIGQGVLAHEGLVTLPTPASLVPVLLALPAAFIVARERRGWPLVALAGLAALALLGLMLAARAGYAASYHSYKVLFLLTPLGAALVGAAAVRIAALPGRTPRLAGPGALVVVLLAAGSFQVVPPAPVTLLSPAIRSATDWLEATDSGAAHQALVLGASPGQAYWVQVGLLSQPRADVTIFRAPQPSAEEWVVDGQYPAVALTIDRARPLPGAIEIARFENVAVVRRADPLDAVALNPLVVRYRTFWDEERLKTAIEIVRPVAGPLPHIELRLVQNGAAVTTFVLEPNAQRTRTQYLGADVDPVTLGGFGYINADAFPSFAPPPSAPAGVFQLSLRLAFGSQVVDERPLAAFERQPDGRLDQLQTERGQLIYLRDPASADRLEGTPTPFEELLLAGWSLPDGVRPGDEFAVVLSWTATRPVERALFMSVQVQAADGTIVAESKEAPQGGFYPTWRWRPGEDVVDLRRIRLAHDLAPGAYRIVLQVHDFAAQRDLVTPAGTSALELGDLLVTR